MVRFFCLFVCRGLTSLLIIHLRPYRIVVPHRNAMPQTQDMTQHTITVYRHGANLLLCHPLMWNVTLEYTTTHICCLVSDLFGKSFSNLPHTPDNAKLYDVVMVVVRGSIDSVPYPPSLEPGTCGVQIHYAISLPTAASLL